MSDNDIYYSLPDDENSAGNNPSVSRDDPAPDSYVLPEENLRGEAPSYIQESSSREVADSGRISPAESDSRPDEQDDPLYYSGVNEDIEDNDEEGDDDRHHSRTPAFLMMLHSLISPIEGWKSIRRSGISSEEFASGCFYPLVALASLSEFAKLLYGEDVSLSMLLIDALLVFLAFFLGYFGALFLGRIIVPGGSEIFEKNFGRIFVMNSMATLALFFVLLLSLPMLEPVLVFLPLWTVYVVCRGVKFLRFKPGSETLSTGIVSLLIIGMPLLMGWVLSEIIPSVSH